MLARDVSSMAIVSSYTGQAGDIDDGPVIAHRTQLRPKTVESARQVNSHHVIPVLVGRLGDGIDDLAAWHSAYAGHIRRPVQAAKVFDSLRNPVLNARII